MVNFSHKFSSSEIALRKHKHKGSLHPSDSPSQKHLLSNMARIAMDLVPIVIVVPGSQPDSQPNSNTFEPHFPEMG